MKVSIVIPAHNEEAFIRQSIEAALAQSYSHCEVIVVDNASTDKTAHIAKKYTNIVFVQEPRKGSQYAREKGRLAAKGDIIACLDADSIPDPDWVQRALIHFQDSRVVSVGGSLDYHDGSTWMRFVANVIQRIVYPIFHTVFHSLRLGGVMIAANAFIRADALHKVGGYDTSIAFYGDDTDTAKRLIKVGKVLFKPSLAVKSSARRYQKNGIIKTFGTYLWFFVWVTFFKKIERKFSLKVYPKRIK